MKLVVIVIAVCSLVLLSGCRSLNYGPLTSRSLGSNLNVKSASWIKTSSTPGTNIVEALEFQGGGSDETTGARIAVDLLAAAAGGLLTSGASTAITAGSALGAGAISDLVQRYLDGKGETAQPPPTPAPQPDPAGLVPRKLPHGQAVPLALPFKGDDSMIVGGIKFRCFELAADSAICDAVRRASALEVRDGMGVAHDFINADGQVMVFQYWTLGTSNKAVKTLENPVRVKNDTRVWYSCHAKE